MRSHPQRTRFLILPAAALAVFLATPLSADWLKTREGALVETRGGWKVKGQIVVFTTANGTLASLRLSEVNLDDSAVATFEAKEKAKEAPREPRSEAAREPVLVLTNEDIPRARRSIEEGEAGEGEGTGEATGPATEPVSVISWQPVENVETGGLEIQGVLQNHGEHIAANLRVLVRLYNGGGELLGSSRAFLDELSLAPSSSVKFRALFPGVTESSVTPEFEVASSAIQLEAVLTDTRDDGES